MGLIDSIGKFADPYDRQARLYPALLAFVPLAIAVTIVFAQHAPMLGNVAVAAAGCGLLYWMTGVARDQGKRLEAGLFRFWGVKPSHLPAMPTDLMRQLFALPSAHRVDLLASASAVVLWTLHVSEERVRGAALSCAERLVAACDVLAGQSPAGRAASSGLPTPLPNRAASG